MTDIKNKPYDDHMPDEDFFRFVYLPFLLVEVIWDYADTLIDISRQMQIVQVKRHSYQVRDLHKEYDFVKSQFMPFDQRNKQEEHMIQFQEDCNDIIGGIFKDLREIVSSRRPDFNEQWNYYYATVLLTRVIMSALTMYSDNCKDRLNGFYGRSLKTIIPRPIRDFAKILPAYLLGDVIVSYEEFRPMAVKIVNLLNGVEFFGTFKDYVENVDINPAIEVVAEVYKVNPATLLTSKTKVNKEARAMLCYLLVRELKLTPQNIAPAIHRRVATVEKYVEEGNALAKNGGRVGECIRRLQKRY